MCTEKRQRIDMRLPPAVVAAVDRLCERKELSRTNYIEMLIRADLKRRKMSLPTKPHYWHGDIEDMPLQM